MGFNLMPFQDYPFNGDFFLEKEFLRLRDKYNIKKAVETGSCLFSSTKWFSDNFNEVITYEMNSSFYEEGIKKIQNKNNVKALVCNSVDGLKQLEYTPKENIIFFLDAHWQAYCPLLDELETISKLDINPIIVIHDFKTNNPEFGYDTHDGKDFDINLVAPKLSKIYPNEYLYYYNTEAAGARRGVIFIEPKTLKSKLDSVVSSIIEQFETRAVKGKEKYGVDLDRTDLSLLEWIEHAKQEHMDAILYLEKIKQEISGKEETNRD
jgi:hypothetical protein